VLDREGVLASVVATVPPRQASALRASLSTRAALLSYLETHPEAVDAVVKDNDVVLVHEMTHAWQDLRDPVFREISRGNLPDTQPLEYEEEAYKTKNLYIHSKLKNAPATVKMGLEFQDYIAMTRDAGSWRQSLFSDLEDASPSRALPLRSLHDIESERLARAKKRAVTTNEEQRAKALDLMALTRGRRELAELEQAHAPRMAALDIEIAAAQAERHALLASYYLLQARSAQRATDRAVWLDQAERYAQAAGDLSLLDDIRNAKERTE